MLKKDIRVKERKTNMNDIRFKYQMQIDELLAGGCQLNGGEK